MPDAEILNLKEFKVRQEMRVMMVGVLVKERNVGVLVRERNSK